MANLTSPVTTYSDTTPHKKVITDYIVNLDPSDSPFVDALGGLDGASGKFKFKNKGTKVEWLEDTLSPLTGALSASVSATTVTSIPVADANMFQEGHILLIGTEQMWVSAVDTSTKILTVTRGYGGTTVATFASALAVEIIGMARLEGDDSDDIGVTDITSPYNYMQIFHKEINVTETMAAINQWGIGSEFDYQAGKAIPELTRLIEKTLAYGQRKAGSASAPRAMGGFSTFITDNTVDYGTALERTNFESAVQAAYEDGGNGPWIAGCSPTNVQTVSQFYDDSAILRVDREESKVGMVIESIVTPFGNVDILLDRWMPTAQLPIVNPKNAGFLTLRPWIQEPLAKTGDAVKGEVVGEFTLCVRQDKSHALLTT